MNCFLIDFENVKSGGLKGIERLTQNDDVFIFYSDYANSITFDIHHKMNLSTANIQFFKSASTGKNALDFQLISYLGYLIAQKRYRNYFVITDDRGFESAIKFWKEFFKQNKLTDLDINRFRNIQDALEKKPVPFRQNLRKNPTIPTVEAELELQQLKAENVIMDRHSPQIEKHIERNLVDTSAPHDVTPTPPVTTPSKPKAVSEPTASATPNAEASTTTVSPTEAKAKSKPIFVNKATSNSPHVDTTPTATESKSVATNTTGNDTQPTTESKPKDEKFKTPKSKNANGSATSTNAPTPQSGKKAFNQPKKNTTNNSNNSTNTNANANTNNNRKPQSSTPQDTKHSHKAPNEASKPAFTGRTKPTQKDSTQPERVQPKNVFKDTTTTQPTPPKTKSFVFGKVNINDDTSTLENIQKKQPTAPSSTKEKDKEKQTVPNVANAQHSNVAKPVETPTTSATPKPTETNTAPKEDRPTNDRKPSPKSDADGKKPNHPKGTSEVVTKVERPQAPVETPKPEKASADTTTPAKPTTTNTSSSTKSANTTSKRKVGRPRVRPAIDESTKPKNNKKFQGEIPKDKLDSMLEKVSKLHGLEDSTKDDTVTICKIVAFSNTKQECYHTLMSCFGKSKGVELYKIVKQEYDALKNLFLS